MQTTIRRTSLIFLATRVSNSIIKRVTSSQQRISYRSPGMVSENTEAKNTVFGGIRK